MYILSVDYMLNNTDVDVVVYQGQLDLICDTKGMVDPIFFFFFHNPYHSFTSWPEQITNSLIYQKVKS